MKIPSKIFKTTFKATGNKEIALADFAGQHIVLYFYPKDNTSGCTQEGQDFKALHKNFSKLNAVVLGVSRDSIKSHEKFKAKYEFPFDLISDPEEVLCNAFDVMKEKSMYGKKYFGIERSTFLIDNTGKVFQDWRKVSVKDHVNEILVAVKNL